MHHPTRTTSRAATASRASLVALLTLLALATLGALIVALAEEPVGIRIDGVDRHDVDRLEEAGFDVAFRGDGYAELLAHPDDLERLTSMGYTWRLLDRDLFPGIRGASDEGNMDPEYHTVQEMIDELTMLANTYPSICRFYDIGDAESKSWWWDNFDHEYDVWAVRISDNPDIDEPEPCIVYDGRHHAREPVSTEIVLAVARYFCENYATDPHVAELVNTSEIWCVPMINIDGHQWVEDVDPWWRKTLFDYNENHHVDADEGIDPNRNYDWHWSSGTWSSQTYGGPYPFRAPCVAAMRDLFNLHRPAINPTFHSYGEVVLYPFGYGVLAEPAVLDIAGEYAGMIGYYPQQSTTPNGSSKDWLYGTVGAAAFTVETANEFIPSGAYMLQEVEQLLPGSIWLCERLWGPSIQGTVTDSIAGVPLEATIHIPEIMDVYGDGELWDIMTEASTGYYCRMRPASLETITLQVSAEGYYDKTLQVTTGGTEATVLNIEMVPESFERGIVQGTVTNATAGGAPVAGATVTVIGGGATLFTNDDGFYSGYVVPGVYQVAASHESFAPDTSGYVEIVIGEITVVNFSLSDIAGPDIANTTVHPSTDDTVGPYEIEATITDMSALTERSLYYRTAGHPFTALAMSPIGLDTYMAAIPGQPLGTVVQYYVQAGDEGGNVAVDPPGAPVELYTFYVAPFETAFEDAMEQGQGDWLHYVVLSGYQDQWHLSMQRNHTLGGTTSWKCGATTTGSYANLLDAGLESPPFTLGESGSLTLWHWMDAEDSGTYPGQAYDGGLVEISVDGGPWEIITPEGGYTHTIRGSSQPGPFPVGTAVFSGTHDWSEVIFDLSAFARTEARVRFRFGSDGNTGGEGWYIDDVLVRSMNAFAEVVQQPQALAPIRCTQLQCSPAPCFAGVGTRVHYELSNPAAVALQVFDAGGRLIASLDSERTAGKGVLVWNGRGRAGQPVGSGLYLMRLATQGHDLARDKIVVLTR